MMTDRPAALEAAVAPTARVLARRAAAKRKRQQMDKDARNTARRGERRRRRARLALEMSGVERCGVEWDGSLRRGYGDDGMRGEWGEPL